MKLRGGAAHAAHPGILCFISQESHCMKHTLILTKNTMFEEAIAALDLGGIGFLALLDEQRRLLGILTDGDIRRAILNRKTELSEIINTKPRTASHLLPQRQVVHLLKEIHRKQMPLVDEKNVYQGVVTLDDFEFNGKPNRVVIMAGGFGKRLGDLTRDLPKPMLRVGKKNMLENLIETFSDYGFNSFYISVHYKSEIIKEYFGDGSKIGVHIEYLEEEQPLGTAGCLSLILEKPCEPFFVINGDVLTTVNLDDLLLFHRRNTADGTMCVKKHDLQIPYGVIGTDGCTITSIVEKPIHSFHVNSGIYVLEPGVIDLVPRDEMFNMTDLFEKMIENKKKTVCYELVDYWVDVGLPSDFEKATKDIGQFR